jgi:hypothetical protein
MLALPELFHDIRIALRDLCHDKKSAAYSQIFQDAQQPPRFFGDQVDEMTSLLGEEFT